MNAVEPQAKERLKAFRTIAREAFNTHMANGGASYRRYPDCHAVSETIKDEIAYSEIGCLDDIDEDSIGIEEIIISGDYYHYVVCVRTPHQYIIDGTFGQFANEFDSPESVAPESEIEDVIACEKQNYIFADRFTNV